MKVAIVTGAGQGIGRAVALRLAKDGFALALVDVVPDGLAAVMEDVRQAGGTPLAVRADLTDIAGFDGVLSRVMDQWDRVDVLVNNAGRVLIRPFLEVTEADWDAMLSINLKTVFFATLAVAQQMIARDIAGRIVNMSSISGRSGRPDQAPYAAAKAGVISLTRSAALALAPHRITVNAICPGVVDTEMTRGIHEARAKALRVTPAESLSKMVTRIPLGRIATPDDIAGAVAFLCSPDAAYITGQAINVCGGIEMD